MKFPYTRKMHKKDLYKNKYRITSTRLPGYDYSQDGAYFITICTKHLKHYFGKTKNGKVVFSPIGEIAQKCWEEISNHFPFVMLYTYVVMPNHVHGILIIKRNKMQDFARKPVETQNLASLRRNRKISIQPNYKNRFGPQSQNLASIIRGYKIGVKKLATANKIPFEWQPRFYDRIIRDNEELDHIKEYIKDNPVQWESDRNYTGNIFI